MDPADLKARIAGIALPLDSIQLTSQMHASVQEEIARTLEAAAAEADRDIVPEAAASADPDLRDDAARLFRRLAQANAWLHGRDDRTLLWLGRASELAASDVLRDMVSRELTALRDAESFSDIRQLCDNGLVDKARRRLAARRRRTTNPVLRKRIEEFLAEPRNFLTPVKAAPPMTTMNGIGTMLWGARAQGADGTYVATLCFVLFFIPLLPIRSYLVRKADAGWSFFGRVPLSPFAFWWRRVVILGPLLAGLALWGWDAWNSSPYVRESDALSKASGQLAGGDAAGALRTLSALERTASAARAARADETAREALSAALAEVKQPQDAPVFIRTAGAAATQLRRAWSDTKALDAAAAALLRASANPDAAAPARTLLEWMSKIFPSHADRVAAAAAQACARCDAAAFLAAAVEAHRHAQRTCPARIVGRLGELLRERRHETWDADALVYLREADRETARPLLHARAESAWKGAAPGTDLLSLPPPIPDPLMALLRLDQEADLEARAAGLEKAAEAPEIEEPQRTWHRLGAARRLADAYGRLNEKDPIRFPVSMARPWAVKAAELSPGDPQARTTALRYLIGDGDFPRAIALGSAAASSDPKTALLVGIAHARSGNPAEAATLLRPLVKDALPAYAKAVAAWDTSLAAKTQSLWKSLETGTANQAFIARLNAMSQERASAEAQKWVQQQIGADPGIAALERTWRDLAEVHPAASELAMVELALGRATKPGPERQARLQEAERLFLELRKVAKDDPRQELQLAQVYFWLGREKEGAEIFSRLESGGDAALLYSMGEVCRQLSRMDEARRLLEKAYDKGTPTEKPGIALLRSLSTHVPEEKLEWLRKSDSSNPRIRAETDQTQAEVSMARGAYAEAVQPLKRAEAYYAGLPEDSTSFNNAAILQKDLAVSTGEFKHQLEALRLMRRAHEQAPEDGIVMGNYVGLIEEVGNAALAGQALRTDLLHEMPGRDWLDFVVPQPTPKEWAERAAAQPELRRAAELGARAVVLSPDGKSGYVAQLRFFQLTRDGEAMRRLREAVEAAPPARKEAVERARAYARGEYTDAERKGVERQLARSDAHLPAMREAKHGPTLAYALSERAIDRLGALRAGLPGEHLQEALRSAEEAVKLFDAAHTRRILALVRMEQACRSLSAHDGELARWLKECPTLSQALLLPLYARKHADRAPAIRARDDVRAAAQEVATAVDSPTPRPWVAGWAWLEMAGHESKEILRSRIQEDPTLLEELRVELLLSPADPGNVVGAWLTAEACGHSDLAARIASEARAAGVVPLFFGK